MCDRFLGHTRRGRKEPTWDGPISSVSAPLTSAPYRRHSPITWAASTGRRSRFDGTAIRVRSLLGYARERSPFYAERLRGLDLEPATAADLASLPALTKAEAQGDWDAIVTTPGLNRGAAERSDEQTWFSYTRHDEQVFSSGGSSGVRGVYVWDWQFFVTTACLAWRMQARDERRRASMANTRLAVLTAGCHPTQARHCSTCPPPRVWRPWSSRPGPRSTRSSRRSEHAPTHLVGYASVIGRLARASLAGDLRIRPSRVSTNSEPLLPEDRDAIVNAWRPRCTTSGDQPKSACRRSVADMGRGCTSAKTK